MAAWAAAQWWICAAGQAQVAAPKATVAGYDEIAETLARGVSAWCESVQSVEGVATAYVYSSPTELQALADDDASVRTGEPADARYTGRGLCVCRFYLGPDTWWCEVAEPVPCGFNPWGLPVLGQTGRDLGEAAAAVTPPVSYSVSDHDKVTLYNAALNHAEIRSREPGDAHGQPMHSVREALLLTQGGLPLGDALLGLVHGDFLGGPTRLVRVTKGPTVRGLECWSLAAYFANAQDEVGSCSVIVCPDRGFMPLSFDSLLVSRGDRKSGMRHHSRVLAEAEVDAGVWLPTETTYHWYRYDGEQASSWRRAQLVRFSELRIGTRAPTFSALPPLGAHVMDTRPGIEGSAQVGQIDRRVRELSESPPLGPDPELDQPLAGSELADVFPRE